MKKILLKLSICLCVMGAVMTQNTFAQSGTFALGVGSDMAGESWQDYSITPTVGYFVSDKMLVGTGFSMESGDNSADRMELSPYVRYYLNSNLYVMGGVSMITQGEADAVTDIDAGVGLSLMWNDKVAIEPGFGVSLGDEKMTLALTIGLSIRLGMDE